jgi:chromosome partitioning protein
MILLIGGEKGGSGKTTLASNIAAWLAGQGSDVVLLDADPQSTAASWCARRRQEHPQAAKVHSVMQRGDLFATAKDLAGRYRQVIIDAGGRDSVELRSGMAAADRLYMPLKASQFDLETSTRTAALVEQARAFNRALEAVAVVSMAPTNPAITEAQEARELLQELPGFRLSGVTIRERKIYRDAAREGLGVVELDNGKARAEMQLLCQEIYGGDA